MRGPGSGQLPGEPSSRQLRQAEHRARAWSLLRSWRCLRSLGLLGSLRDRQSGPVPAVQRCMQCLTRTPARTGLTAEAGTSSSTQAGPEKVLVLCTRRPAHRVRVHALWLAAPVQ